MKGKSINLPVYCQLFAAVSQESWTTGKFGFPGTLKKKEKAKKVITNYIERAMRFAFFQYFSNIFFNVVFQDHWMRMKNFAREVFFVFLLLFSWELWRQRHKPKRILSLKRAWKAWKAFKNFPRFLQPHKSTWKSSPISIEGLH